MFVEVWGRDPWLSPIFFKRMKFTPYMHTYLRLISNCENVPFVMRSNKNPQMPSWQCYHFKAVSGLCRASNQNAELHNGYTFQECL